MDSLELENTASEQSSETQSEMVNTAKEDVQPTLQDASETPQDETPSAEEQEPQTEEKSYASQQEILDRLNEIVSTEEGGDRQELATLKQLFYKFHNQKIQEAHEAYMATGADPDKFMPEPDLLEPQFRTVMQTLRERRAAIRQKNEQEKIKNMERKRQILERIQQLAETPDEANQNFDEFKALQAEWKEIKAVPAEHSNELWKSYQHQVEQYYDLLKLGHELRDYDFRKNLELKTKLCEEAEALAENEDIIQASATLQQLHQEWKETGPVARDLREELWNRFKAASTVINKRHQAHFEAIKKREEENLIRKTALCEQLESFETDGLKTFAEWDDVTQKIIELQKEWKTIGFAPQKMNNRIFERFRKGCDQFFEKKSLFFRELKESLNENLARKRALVEKAEALKDSTEWRSTTDTLINLQKQWKEIGSVPRKYSDALWKQFVSACDTFFEAKKQAFASRREEENENLKEKMAIIEQLKELAEKAGDNMLQEVRKLQQQWSETKHVAYKDKDRVFKEYRHWCDKIYDALSISHTRRQLNNFRQNLSQKLENGESSLQQERQRLQRAYDRMRDEIKIYENNLGFLTSKSGNNLLDVMNKKVEKQRQELDVLAQKIKAVEEQIAQQKDKPTE